MKSAVLLAVTVTGLSCTGAHAQPPISDRGRVFAAQILGAGRAAQVERLEAVSFPLAPWATRIRFYYPPTSLPGELCQRVGYETRISFDPVREGREQLRDLVGIAVGPDCRSANRSFALVESGLSAAEAAESLRSARRAQAAAGAAGSLPFNLSCEDELNLDCTDEGRAVLAGLAIGRAEAIGPEGILIEGESGPFFGATGRRAVWRIAMSHFAERDARVALIRRRPQPF